MAYKTRFPRTVNGLRQDAKDALTTIEPYKSGKGHDLWVLNTLNNIDKHRLILTVGSAFHDLNVGAHMSERMRKAFGDRIPRMDLYLSPADNLFPLKQGDELFIDAPEAEPNEKMNFRFAILIHEPGVIEGKPVTPTIKQFADLVSNTVASFRPYLG